MSFQRFVFYCAFIGGWAAYAGWLLSEALFMHRAAEPSTLAFILTFALVGASIGGGLNLLAGCVHGTLRENLPRLWAGLGGGIVSGAIGAVIGNLLYNILPIPVLARALGWTLIGILIGIVEGIYDRSWQKIRNGLIGGAVGGFLGGLLFELLLSRVGGVMASRAAAFVILGLCIGLFVGLAQVILKEAWLTVVEGFRPGRQVALNFAETNLGTSEKAQLPFIAFGAKGVEPIHLRILRQPDGRFVLHDNNSRTGTMLNGTRLVAPTILRNNDLIQLGPNTVRYCERFRQGRGAEARPMAGQSPLPAMPASEAIKPVPAPPTARPVPAQPMNIPTLPTGKIEPSPARRAPQAPPRPATTAGGITAKPAPPKSAPPKPTPPKPAPPSPAFDALASDEQDNCPICGRDIKGPTGRRLCDNCGIKF